MTEQTTVIHERDASLPGALSFTLARDPSCAAAGRRMVRESVGGALSEPALERVLLAVSELVTNAWKHGQGAIELRLAKPAPNVLHIAVIDEGRGASPRIREAGGDASGGWGLRILDELALRWGCLDGATHVWADLPAR